VDKSVVELVALNQEHAHSDFVGSLSFDLSNGFLVHLDALNVQLLVSFFLDEFLDFLGLLQDEEILVIDVDSFFSDQQILLQDLLNLSLGSLNNLIILTNHPEMSFVRVGDLVVGTRDVIDSLDHASDHLDKF